MSKKEKLIEGIYTANQKKFGFVKTEKEEIHIASINRNNALNGDKVLVKIINENTEQSKEGKIIRILNHAITQVVGTFKKSKNFGFVVPDDKKINTDIYISKKKSKDIKNNEKVVARIIRISYERKKC